VFGDGDPFLGETVGKKRKDSSGLDEGIAAGFEVLTDAAPAPVALVGALVVGVGLLGFLAWKAVERASRKKTIG